MKKQCARTFRSLITLFITILFVGCEVDSSESGSRNVDINVWGVYQGQADHYGTLVNNSSGSRPEYFDLRQYGDQVEAIDNHGIIFRGTIGSVNSEAKTCSYTLEGKTTVGNRVIVNGHINISGSIAIMEGTWMNNLYAVLYGKATAPAQPTNQPANTLLLEPTSYTLGTNGTFTLKASGGMPPYEWDIQNPTDGKFTQEAGNENKVYQATKPGVTNYVTVTDKASGSKKCVIIQQ